MKLTILFWAFLLIPSLVFGQDISNRIGVLTINENLYTKENGLIQLLNDDGTTWYEFTLYYDDSDGQWDYVNKKLNILAFHPDYFLFEIECTNETEEYYEVVVNEATQLSKRIVKSPEFKLLTWEQYVLNVFAIDFDRDEYPIFHQKNGIPVSNIPDQNLILRPVIIEGDWMKIQWSDVFQPTKPEHVHDGWIKWRESNRIMIELYHIN